MYITNFMWIFTQLSELFLILEFYLSLNNCKFYEIGTGSYSAVYCVNILLLIILKAIYWSEEK